MSARATLAASAPSLLVLLALAPVDLTGSACPIPASGATAPTS